MKENNAAQAAQNAIEWATKPGAVENFPATARAHINGLASLLLSKLRAPVADEHCSACNPQVFSVEQLEKDPLLVARLWRKPADTDGSLVERILEHVSEYGESMASSSLLSVRKIARRNLEARIEAELADAMRSQDESPLREALSEIASAWSARTRLPEEDGIQALKDIARAALASAPADERTACATDVCQAGRADGVLCANDECDLANGVRPASAPVAGEAQRPTDDELRDLAVKYDVSQDAMRRWHFRDVVPLLREVLALYAAPQASAKAFDFVAHLARQAEFSARTFGPGARVAGVCDHIRKELAEVEASGGDLKEWVDVIILGLDGAWRSGATPKQIIAAIVAKQAKNEARTWPDWRTMDPNKAIEHQRNDAPCSCPSGDGSLRHPCAKHPGADKDGGQQRAGDDDAPQTGQGGRDA
ncbi:dATP/dGTP pyrophosphohydrolase domain-containing protein [Achromobacter xylosoxidans]